VAGEEKTLLLGRKGEMLLDIQPLSLAMILKQFLTVNLHEHFI